ncbi:MAG: hypothetical protein ACRDPC_16985 [Solirubrobacteraceae bacterium]
MFGRGNQVLLRAGVHFYGVRQFEADDDAELRASVDLPDASAPDGAPAFLPLIACRLLYNSRAERAITTPMMWILREAVNEVIASEVAGRAFSFHGGDWQEDTEFYDEMEALLIASMPHLVSSSSERADQSFRAELMQGRNGMLWAKIHAPRRGPAFFAAFGLFCLLEHAARHAPYEEQVVPAMAGLLTLSDLYFDVLDQEKWDSLGAMTTFQTAVTRTALAADPKEHLTEVRKQAGIHGIHGPDPWVPRADQSAGGFDAKASASGAPLDLPPLKSRVAESMRRGIERLLDEPTEISDDVKALAGRFADNPEYSGSDWNVAVDVFVMGYRLRAAEWEVARTNSIDADYAAKLRAWHAEDRQMALAAGAVRVVETLSDAFHEGQLVWEEIRDWAISEALCRSKLRHTHSMEDGDEATVDRDAAGRVFDLGYGTAFAEETIAAGGPRR